MRVTILTLGSLGDVAPFLGLGKGLAARGHGVRIATYGRYGAAIAEAGLEHYVLPGDPARLLRSASSQGIARAGTNPLAYWRSQRAQARAIAAKARPLLDEALAACGDAELIVYSLTALMGGAIAEARGVPAVQAFLTPVTPTRAFASILAGRDQSRLGPLGNLLGHYVAEWALTAGFRRLLDDWRGEVLHLPPARPRGLRGWSLRGGPLAEAERRRCPRLYGISPEVLPAPPDWGDWTEETGYWPPPLPRDWAPPAALEAFLAEGEPPVCVGFGSMGEADGQRLTALVLAALARVGRRAVLLSGWGALDPGELPDGIHLAESVPHAWLLPRVAAMVHAGGAGTSAAVFRAGLPAVVVPFSGDQFFWARRAAALGVAPPPHSWRQLTAEQLADGLDSVLSEPSYRAAAARLAGRLAGEDGVARAVAAIERLGPRSRDA
ncbi:MAG: glycosyltransferase [Tistlia sp.]|uniref:glycosyltransferase n=1 Tax=Tistlia sp. TaxID=3057121 RepID=UPI0034A21C1E